MKTLFKYLFVGLKYLMGQGIAEIMLIVLLEYVGFKVLPYFSEANLFIENVQGVVWEISMKTIIFSMLYIPLFVGVCALLSWKGITSNLRYSAINTLLNILLFIGFHFLIRHSDFSEVLNLFITTVLASALIVAIVKIRERKKHQTDI